MGFSYAYIMASQRRLLYIGVTGNQEARVWQHKLVGSVVGIGGLRQS